MFYHLTFLTLPPFRTVKPKFQLIHPRSQHWSWRKDTGSSCYQTRIVPNATTLSLAETFSVRATKPKQTEKGPKASYWVIPKITTLLCIIQPCKQLTELAEVLCIFTKEKRTQKAHPQLLSATSQSKPCDMLWQINSGDIWPLSPMQYNTNYLLWVWIHPSLLNKSFYTLSKYKSLGLRFIPLLIHATKTGIPQATQM